MEMYQKIKGQTAIVTGGGQGLGEVCQGWIGEGCNVVVADINYEAAKKLQHH